MDEDQEVKPLDSSTPKLSYNIDELFSDARSQAKSKNLSCLLYGPPEAGKTFLALMFPGPLYVLDLDSGVGPNLKYVSSEKSVKKIDCISIDDDQENIDSVDYDPFRVRPMNTLKKIDHAITVLQQIHGGTVIVDTITHVDQWLSALLNTEIPKQINEKGKEFTPIFDWKYVNSKYNWLMEKLKNIDANLVLIARSKPIYINGKPTDQEEMDARRGTDYHVSIAIHMTKEVSQGSDGKVITKRISKFSKFRGNKLAKEYQEEDLTYDRIMEILNAPENTLVK